MIIKYLASFFITWDFVKVIGLIGIIIDIFDEK